MLSRDRHNGIGAGADAYGNNAHQFYKNWDKLETYHPRQMQNGR